MELYWFDNFEKRIVNKRVKTAPPERYFEVYPTTCGIYQDSYLIPESYSGNRIDFAYTKEESWQTDYTLWHNLLKAHLENHGVGQAINSLVLIRRGYPKEEFEEILKEYK